MKFLNKYLGQISALLGFLLSYGFFQFAYPYHLMRREQLNLFLFDGPYISQTYRGAGWLSRFLGDFVDQFLGIPVLGPVLIALIITAIAAVVYKCCRRFLGKKLSLTIAAVVFVWAFLRETENQYLTQYSLAVLGYLSFVYACFQFKKNWIVAASSVVAILVGLWAFGNPYHKHYGRLIGVPELVNEKVIALDVESSKENWDKIVDLTKQDLRLTQQSYYFNLAHAMKGELGNEVLNHTQNMANTLFLWVDSGTSPFANGIAGDVWFHLGDMTIAEQSAIVGLQSSPKHTGVKYLTRLAEVNLISDETGLALKYLNMLDKTLFYRKWAEKRMPGNQDEATVQRIAEAKAKLSKTDMTYGENNFRPVLQALVAANPDNRMAREYLLCYDLLRYDLESFMEDYKPQMIKGNVYEEATIIWLNLSEKTSQEEFAEYGVTEETLGRLNKFYRHPDRYHNTYWYYYSK